MVVGIPTCFAVLAPSPPNTYVRRRVMGTSNLGPTGEGHCRVRWQLSILVIFVHASVKTLVGGKLGWRYRRTRGDSDERG